MAHTARGFYHKFRAAHPNLHHRGTAHETLTHPEAVLEQLEHRVTTRNVRHMLRLFGEAAGDPSQRVVSRATFRHALRGIFHGISDAQADAVRI